LESGLELATAVRHTLKQLRGANAVVILNLDQPDQLICARLGNAGGITIGLGEDEMFIASDIPAILEYTRRSGDDLTPSLYSEEALNDGQAHT
jgi:glucosamine--fructose-6-phosphate aminotransferase (isomerizing)